MQHNTIMAAIQVPTFALTPVLADNKIIIYTFSKGKKLCAFVTTKLSIPFGDFPSDLNLHSWSQLNNEHTPPTGQLS